MSAICVLRPQGRIDSATGPALDDEIAKSMASGANRLLLDMADVDYISSAGLRVVLQAAKQTKSVGGHLVLCALNEQTREIFDVSGFSRFLDISDSREEAEGRLAG